MTTLQLNSLEQTLTQAPVIAVIRGSTKTLEGILDRLLACGVLAVEITTNTPGWQQGVTLALSKGFTHVGVGTVVSTDHVSQASDLGANFTVAPGLDPQVVQSCRDMDLIHVPGVSTPSEIQTALALGLSTLKLFPAAPMGMNYLAALKGPFDRVRFIPTGGVTLASASEWMAAGAFAVGLGGALTSGNASSEREDSNLLRALIVSHQLGSKM